MPESTNITGLESRMRAIEVGSEKPAETLLSECSIEAYTYTNLSDPSTEIRLLNLLPGVKDDPIIVQIDHAYLTDRASPIEPYVSQNLLKDINESLPAGWMAYVTSSHRVIYYNPGLELSTWEKPAVTGSVSSQENAFIPAPDESEDNPHYEALSYTWGSKYDRKVIYVRNSDREHRKLLVTKDLLMALRHLRSTLARTLWIDAICINQKDMEERKKQVQRMPSIYRLAHRVVAWLGPASDSSSLAMSTLAYLGEQFEMCEDRMIPSPRALERHWYRCEVALPYDEETWDAVLRLCQRPYFTRVWIMQELNLSNHCTIIQCGSDSISWMSLRKAVQLFLATPNLPSDLFRHTTTVVRQLADYNARAPYSQTSMAVRERHCSNARDRVYGLLGLMPEGLRSKITPNYEATVGEVYRQDTVAQIDFFQRLDVLRECGAHRAIDGPSWVPNLALPHFPVSFLRSASGVSRCYVSFHSYNVAEASGLQVGMVKTVQEKGHWKFGEGLKHTKAWAYQDLDRDVYALTLCGMLVSERWQSKAYGSQIPSLEEWKRFYFEDVENTDDTNQVITPLFLQYVEQFIWLKTLFIMSDGQIGLGPETMKAGDAVCIFLGCDSPMIIRQQSDGAYRVVGEAFVYTLRDAHALLGPLPEPWLVIQASIIRPVYFFSNGETGEVTENDPRLDPLIGWERLDVEMGADDPPNCRKYKNIETGQVINYDPRMSLDALKARGVKLRTFSLS